MACPPLLALLLAFTAPEPFQPAPEALGGGTRSLAPVVGSGRAERRLLALYESGSGAEAAHLAHSEVGIGLSPQRIDARSLGVAVAQQVGTELGLGFHLERAEWHGLPTHPWAEVSGQVVEGATRRALLVGFLPGADRYQVVVAAWPPSREADLRPAVLSALEGSPPLEATQEPSRSPFAALPWVLGGLLLAWRFRRGTATPTTRET